jgi:hypothetical protein
LINLPLHNVCSKEAMYMQNKVGLFRLYNLKRKLHNHYKMFVDKNLCSMYMKNTVGGIYTVTT